MWTYDGTCSRRSRRISVRASAGQRNLIPARFGGSASSVCSDNVSHQLDINDITRSLVDFTIERVKDSERLSLSRNCLKKLKVNGLATLVMDVTHRTGGKTVQNLLSILKMMILI